MWDHQREAVAASTAELASAPRATAVMACGTGKTRVGAETAKAVAPTGPVLIMVPTLDLLAQTLGEWVDICGHQGLGQVIAVCGDSEVMDRDTADDLSSLQVQVTTDPAHLAELLGRGGGRSTVAITYQSQAILAVAHREYGLRPWRLAVVDEAHRTAGAKARSWSVIHDDVLIPADKRLYLTATPRLVAVRAGEVAEVFSMEDEKTYGRVAYRLGFGPARAMGLLADYRVVVCVITDDEVRQLAATGQDRPEFLDLGPRAVAAPMLAAQVAVLRAAHQYNVQRMITYHHRVKDAQWFARTLPAADALITPPTDGTPELVTGAVHGGQAASLRRAELGKLAASASRRVVISNSRVLAEGIDVPAVDGVAFIDARDSPIDTIQAIGRALRLGGRPDKVAHILVPVVLAPDQDPVAALEASAYEPVWRITQALCAHDEDFVRSLNAARASLGHSPSAAGLPRSELPQWLQFAGATPIPAGFAAAIGLHAVRTVTESWEEYFGAARAYREVHQDLLIPVVHRTESGLRLGAWLAHQRHMFNTGRLREDRRQRLDDLGAVWDRHEVKNQRRLKAAREFHATHGHLRVPTDYYTDGDDPVDLGPFLLRLRRGQYLRDELKNELDNLGFTPDAAKDDYWRRMLAAATAYRNEHGDLLVPTAHVTDTDELPLGVWLAQCRNAKKQGNLTTRRIQELDALGIAWDARAQRWNEGYKAAERYFRENGHLKVPSTFAEPGASFKLGIWIRRQRKALHNGTLTPQQIADLNTIHMVWSVMPQRKRH
nr:Helicase associated domain protein [Streptomyces sp. NBC_00899]